MLWKIQLYALIEHVNVLVYQFKKYTLFKVDIVS